MNRQRLLLFTTCFLLVCSCCPQRQKTTKKDIQTRTKEMAASDLADFITKESSQWEKDVANGDVSMIFLYACHAGEGDNSVAQDLSLELSDYGAFVIAPIGILESSSDPRYPKDGKYQGVKNNRGQEGTWGVYKNGKLETTIRGNKSPTKATVKCKLFLDNLWQSIKNFFSHENE